MIKTYLHDLQLGTGAQLAAALNKFLKSGFVPMTTAFIPAVDGPGALLYTLGRIGEGASAGEVDEHAGNGSAETLPQGEVITTVSHDAQQ